MTRRMPANRAIRGLVKMDNDRIQRFSVGERVTHWVHTLSFFVLLLTGLVVFSPKFHFITALTGGVEGARIIHRAAGIVFGFVSLVIFFIGDRTSFIRWLKEITFFQKSDIKFLQGFAQEFMGGHPELPEQGRFNAGQKINSLMVLVVGTILTITGFMMWFAEAIPLEIIRWAYPLHDLAALGMTAVIIAHMYLGLLHPGSKESIHGMIYGTITRTFAKTHHALWYREVTKESTKENGQ